MERWCQQINVHYFCFETALFGKIFGHMCKEKICVPPPTLRGLTAQKKLYAVSRNFFSTPPLGAVQASQSTPASTPAASPKKTFLKQRQQAMVTMMKQLNTTHVSDDFVAAFLQAGITPNKLDHPSIRGLIQKYTEVHRSLVKGSALHRNADRVGEVREGAVRSKLQKKLVRVSTDEWTDSQGHAIMNVIIGSCDVAYVCSSK